MGGIPLRYSVRNLWRRPARTVLTVLGLSLLVALIVFLTSFGRSFGRSLRMPGAPRNLIVLSKKAQTFELSSISSAELDAMAGEVGDSLLKGPDGGPLFSKEVYHFVNVLVEDDPEKKRRRALLHGIDPDLIPGMLHGFELTWGRMPDPDMKEIIVGRAAPSRLKVDEKLLATDEGAITVRDELFVVVGGFKAPGTLYENWIVTTPDDLRVVLGRRDFSFARMKVRPDVDMNALGARLSRDERYEVQVLPEAEYFADFAEGFTYFQRLATVLAILLAVGGVLTGMNTMHNAVVGRTREIGTLRVLGFGRLKIFFAFLVEALLLTGMAGILGCALGILTNGLPVSVPIAATFPVTVDGPSLAAGFGAAWLMGILGLVFPMIRALRLPAVDAMRAA